MTREFGGLGGVWGGRSRNQGDEFENAVERALGERLREEGLTGEGMSMAGESLGARLWGTLANEGFRHENGDTASYSFRAAGDLIAAIVGEGDYLDWYCSQGYQIRDPEVLEALASEGWLVAEGYWDDDGA